MILISLMYLKPSLRAERQPQLSSPRMRGSSTPRFLGSIIGVSGILDRPPSRTMTARCILAAHYARGLLKTSRLRKRGRREDRVRAAPAVSRAMCTGSAHTSIQVQRRASGLPCAMGLRLIRDLPGEPCTFATVDARLGASGPHDFAVRIMRVRLAHSASTASHHAFVAIASAPLVG